MTYCRK